MYKMTVSQSAIMGTSDYFKAVYAGRSHKQAVGECLVKLGMDLKNNPVHIDLQWIRADNDHTKIFKDFVYSGMTRPHLQGAHRWDGFEILRPESIPDEILMFDPKSHLTDYWKEETQIKDIKDIEWEEEVVNKKRGRPSEEHQLINFNSLDDCIKSQSVDNQKTKYKEVEEAKVKNKKPLKF